MVEFWVCHRDIALIHPCFKSCRGCEYDQRDHDEDRRFLEASGKLRRAEEIAHENDREEDPFAKAAKLLNEGEDHAHGIDLPNDSEEVECIGNRIDFGFFLQVNAPFYAVAVLSISLTQEWSIVNARGIKWGKAVVESRQKDTACYSGRYLHIFMLFQLIVLV